jgi:mannose-6-phosphate isomerase-like protein (cupin superfamily)
MTQAGFATSLSALEAARTERYHEFLRVPALSAGVYRLGVGAADLQVPHAEDEIYHVVAGRAAFLLGDARLEVGPGSILFVPAGVQHRFVDIAEPLVTLVFFGPAES